MVTLTYNKWGNPENKREVTFESTHYEHPDIIAPGTKDVPIVWSFKGDPEDVQRMHPNCGCTSNIEQKNNTITAVYEDNAIGIDAKLVGNKELITKELMDIGYVDVVRDLDVYFADGLPDDIKIGLSKIPNPNKTRVKLTFHVKVDITSLDLPHLKKPESDLAEIVE